MSDIHQLPKSQIDFFNDKGYLILTDTLTNDQVSHLEHWTNEVKSAPPKTGEGHMPYEEIDKNGKRILCRTENFANTHQGFNQLLRSPRILSTLSQLTSEKMYLFKEKINYKQPFAGGFDPHIDSTAYNHIDDKAQRHLTILMAVEDADESNGCLEVVPGSQREKVPIDKGDNCIDKKWVAGREWVPVPLKAGHILIFGSYLAHRSGPNNSSYGRAAIYATYNCESDGGDIHDAYYEHRRKVWPPSHERKPGEKYEEGALLYGFGSPMLTVQGKD